jgi:hypothetical protein
MKITEATATIIPGMDAPSPKLTPPPELLNPASQAYVNALVSAAVKEAVAGLHAQLAQVQTLTPSNSLTSEGLVAALAEAERIRKLPTESEAAKLRRQAREKKAMREEEERNRENRRLTQESCAHRYPNSQLSVAAVNNYFDRYPRFICFRCQLLIEPRHWECGFLPTEENPKGTDRIVDAHPLYVAIAKEYAVTHQQG